MEALHYVVSIFILFEDKRFLHETVIHSPEIYVRSMFHTSFDELWTTMMIACYSTQYVYQYMWIVMWPRVWISNTDGIINEQKVIHKLWLSFLPAVKLYTTGTILW